MTVFPASPARSDICTIPPARGVLDRGLEQRKAPGFSLALGLAAMFEVRDALRFRT